MRLLLLSLFAACGIAYGYLAFRSYEEERLARESSSTSTVSPDFTAIHPEANLRVLREAMERDDYSDALLPHLETALEEAPASYQAPLLMAAFYANRMERPDLIRRSFEAALARFPTNGRLHLSFAEWLLTPRETAPYRAYRDDDPSGRGEAQKRALDEIQRATALEPDLTRQALAVLIRFQTPVADWADKLPRTDATRALMLEALDRSPGDRETRKRLLSEFLAEGSSVELFRSLDYYADRWNEPEIALGAAERWRETALDQGMGSELARATSTLARRELDGNEEEEAYRLLRETLATMEERNLPSESALELLCSLGDVYLNRRQAGTAQGLFSEAVARSRDYVPAYLGLARTYQASGDLESAARELERALSLDPSNARALRQMEEIRKLSLTRR
jgi:Tfp pilus assembly protein PilF